MLVGVDPAHSRHGADGGSSHLGIDAVGQDNRRARQDAAGISLIGVGVRTRVVAVDHVVHGDSGAPCAHVQGVRRTPAQRFSLGTLAGVAGKEKAAHLRRYGNLPAIGILQGDH